MAIVYYNGRYLPSARARVPVDDPALEFGAGVFEVLRGYGRIPFRLEDHLVRLRRTARRFGIAVRLPNLAPVIPRLFERNRLRGGYIRLTLTGGGRVVVIVRRREPLDPRVESRGARLAVAPWRRDPAAPLAGHKTLNYLDLMLTRAAAQRGGAVDALILSPEGDVLEGSRSNLFAVRDGRVTTPASRRGILPGVTRRVVFELARRAGVPVGESRLSYDALLAADEVFVTSTMMEVVPIAGIAGQRIGPPGPVTRALREAYRERVRAECGCWP